MNWYRQHTDEVLTELKTRVEGLDDSEWASRLQEHGRNELRAAKERSRLAIFLSQFKDIMILILAVAAVVSFVAGETTDAIVILAIIIVNAVIGYYQEYNAERSIRMLQKMAAQHALVLRNGKTKDIDAAELVPGDIVLLEAGNVVPADARLIESASLKAEEAALTGESDSVHKTVDALQDEDMLPADQVNMVFKGTVISNGTGTAVVVSTGMKTEMGKIAGMLDIEQQKTPLQQRLSKFSKQLAVIVILICAGVFAYGLMRGEQPLRMFLTALSLAVAALPEALLVVVTIGLAQGARRMVKQ
ncbi:MAG: HAD-IC family P-type ATPase, partial [Taibaiella sp.]|nr:HAD-IC family P-type ATPase [Taibaiella sp.]